MSTSSADQIPPPWPLWWPATPQTPPPPARASATLPQCTATTHWGEDQHMLLETGKQLATSAAATSTTYSHHTAILWNICTKHQNATINVPLFTAKQLKDHATIKQMPEAPHNETFKHETTPYHTEAHQNRT